MVQHIISFYYEWTCCSLFVFFLATVGLGKMLHNTQNIRTYYMLNHRIRCIYSQYKNKWEVPNLFSPHLIQPWRHQVFGPAQLWSDFSALRIWHVPLHEVAFQSEGPGHLPVMNVRRTLRYDPEPKGYRQHQAAEWSQTTYNTNQVNIDKPLFPLFPTDMFSTVSWDGNNNLTQWKSKINDALQIARVKARSKLLPLKSMTN